MLVILLRGINVGKTRSLPMKELVAILESLGLERVRTYIQSGNVVAEPARAVSPHLADEIAQAVEDRKGFRPQVLVLTNVDLDRAGRENPFPEAEAEPRKLHLFFLADTPESPDLEAIEAIKAESERFVLTDRVFYLHAPDGFGRSKLAANAEKLLGVPVTVRNWRTVKKLREMAEA
jgi:uncharacterized protein (DUF1697 family)